MTKTALCLLLIVLSSPAARAIDSMAVSAGPSTDANEVRLAVGWKWDKRWFTEGDWHLTGYLEADVGVWNGHGGGAVDIYNLGITPIFRLVPNDPNHSRWFWEFGVGAQYLSDDHINRTRRFGSRLLFGDVFGVGTTLGSEGKYEIGYRFWHLSNANLADENDGITFHELRLNRRF